MEEPKAGYLGLKDCQEKCMNYAPISNFATMEKDKCYGIWYNANLNTSNIHNSITKKPQCILLPTHREGQQRWPPCMEDPQNHYANRGRWDFYAKNEYINQPITSGIL